MNGDSIRDKIIDKIIDNTYTIFNETENRMENIDGKLPYKLSLKEKRIAASICASVGHAIYEIMIGYDDDASDSAERSGDNG